MSSVDEIRGRLAWNGCSIRTCGSRVTCDPPPTDTDEDYLVFAPANRIDYLFDELTAEGFILESTRYKNPTGRFTSWRRGQVNFIVTSDPTFRDSHELATFLCKRLNLMSKNDRIAVFQALLYGHYWYETDVPA